MKNAIFCTDREMNKFRENLEKKRDGMTIKEFSKELGVSERTYKGWINPNNYEPKQTLPNMANALTICEKYGWSLDYLFGRTEYTGIDHDNVGKLLGLSPKAVENLFYYKQSYLVDILNILLSSNAFSQVLAFYSHFLDSDYCIPIHSDENGDFHISEIAGWDEDGIKQRAHNAIMLAKSEKDLGDSIEIGLDSVFVETMAMNTIRDYLKDIKTEYNNRKGKPSASSKSPK